VLVTNDSSIGKDSVAEIQQEPSSEIFGAINYFKKSMSSSVLKPQGIKVMESIPDLALNPLDSGPKLLVKVTDGETPTTDQDMIKHIECIIKVRKFQDDILDVDKEQIE
jgi:hypothetical protein